MASRRGGRAEGTAVMGQLCHQQPPTTTPPRSLGNSGGLPGAPLLLLLLLLLLASSMCACKGAPMPSQALEADQDLQLWKEDVTCVSTWAFLCPFGTDRTAGHNREGSSCKMHALALP
nr:neuromedin-U isoform X6 [Anser cygnoides]